MRVAGVLLMLNVWCVLRLISQQVSKAWFAAHKQGSLHEPQSPRVHSPLRHRASSRHWTEHTRSSPQVVHVICAAIPSNAFNIISLYVSHILQLNWFYSYIYTHILHKLRIKNPIYKLCILYNVYLFYITFFYIYLKNFLTVLDHGKSQKNQKYTLCILHKWIK